MSEKNGKMILDIAVEDGVTAISRNYDKSLIIRNEQNKELLALLDAIIHPDKYTIHIHDLRKKEVYSSLSSCI